MCGEEFWLLDLDVRELGVEESFDWVTLGDQMSDQSVLSNEKL